MKTRLCHPMVTPLPKETFYPRVMRTAKRTAPNMGQIDSRLSVTHILGLGEGDTAPHAGPHKAALGGRLQPGAARGRLHGIKRVGCPLVPTGGCDQLA